MACANRGFYVHLSTMAEVRERVLEHTNVLARPLVLQREEHPVLWTQVYANVDDPKVADYLWDQRERAEQKQRFMIQRRDKTLVAQREQDRKWRLAQMKQGQYSEVGNMNYQLMTSVSMPVYDTREYQSVEEPEPAEVRIANLLGVAGTDVPLQEIQALMTPHKVGVNGYAFMVNNNGYVLIHPDLRPVFQGILKPAYNSVDMLEVELMDDDRGARNWSLELLAMRKHIIDQNVGSERMNVKYHLDDMKRVSRVRRHYFWRGIPESPFTLIVTVPEPYGLHRITPPPADDIHRTTLTGKGVSARQYFKMPGKWSVHPDWLYCRHYNRTFSRPEQELLYFLERAAKPGWRWPIRPRPPEHHPTANPDLKNNHSAHKSNHTKERVRENYYCDHGLMQALVFDARNTEWFNQNISISPKEDFKEEFIKRFGVTTAFLATHSGLTRWQTFPAPTEPHADETEFGKLYPRAIDEVWYRRAVEQHYVDPNSFVYSAEFNAGLDRPGEGPTVGESLVTASHAVFHSDGGKKAPAAVVGFQFHHRHLKALFHNITSANGEGSTECSCRSEELSCFLLDSSGYVVVSSDDVHTGHLFTQVRGDVMARLVEDKVYRAMNVLDYQAVCFRLKKPAAHNRAWLHTPLNNLHAVLRWFVATFVWVWRAVAGNDAATFTQDFDFVTSTVTYDLYGNDETSDLPYDDSGPAGGPGGPAHAKERDFDQLLLINRTRPTPCDTQITLYQLLDSGLEEKFDEPMRGCDRPYVVQMVANTNLLLVIVDALCPAPHADEERATPPHATEVPADGSLPCRRHLQGLYRALPESCISRHHNESMITMCGRGQRVKTTPSTFTALLSPALILLAAN